VFNLPHKTNLARMLRADLAEARKIWLAEARRDPDEYAWREQSDFLIATNHDGEVLDFHSLKHTCGAWLAMSGVHPKVVQSVMQHSSIVLTMDTYGHLFPGQEADAVGQMRELLDNPPEILRATGTDDNRHSPTHEAQHEAQQSVRERRRRDATGCDDRTKPALQQTSPKSLHIADLSDDVRRDAKENESRPGGIRTPDQGIMSPLL